MQNAIVRPAGIRAAVGFGKTLAYAKLDPKSPYYDPTWPRPVKLSARAVGWKFSELQAWLEAQERAGKAAA